MVEYGKILGPTVQSLEQALNENRLSWLGHILRMATEHLCLCVLLCEALSGWKMVWDDRLMTRE